MRLLRRALPLAALLLARAACAQDAVTIRLDPTEPHQTITGWEATPDIPDTPAAPYWADWHDAALDLAADAGITRVRIDIQTSTESATGMVSDFISGRLAYADWKDHRYDTQNDNADPFVIDWAGFDFAQLDWYMDNTVLPLRDRLAARGDRLFINVCYVAFRSGRYFQMEPEEYAEFVLATYRHLDRAYGIVPDGWEVILEPDLPKDGWTGTDIGRAIVATARRLEAAGYRPAFVVPSVTDMRNAVPYLDAIAAVPGAIEHVTEFSYHRYRGQRSDAVVDIARRGAELGIPTAMLELWLGRASYHTLFDDLTRGNVSAWQSRMLEGLFRPGNDGQLQPQGEVRYTAEIFRAVRPGAVRIGASSDRPATADAVAFINPGGGYAVAVRSRGATSVTISALPPGRYRITYALADDSPVRSESLSVADGSPLILSIAATGIVTVAAD